MVGFDLSGCFSHNHTLSLSGGTANMKYYASLGYNRENGILRKEGLNRYTAAMRLNLNYERFNVAFSMTGNVQEKVYSFGDGIDGLCL
ncbi:MAG: hypothetical protein ACLSDJ_11020 [Butyricimonas faecihominis]